MSRSLAVDTHSLIFRSFYAAAGGENPIPASLAIMRRMLAKAVSDVSPHYVIAASDCREPTFRHKLDPTYKASRSPAPEELKQLLPIALSQLADMGIPLLRCPGYEADDILATLAIRIKSGHSLCVLSSDRDLVGLVRPGVDLLLLQNGGRQRRITHEQAHELFGVPASQVADYKALAGDSSDNIPGVVGIGPKTTVSLLQQYGSLQSILDSSDRLTGKAALLRKPRAAEDALRCQQLAQLYSEVPIEFDASAARWTEDKAQRLRSH